MSLKEMMILEEAQCRMIEMMIAHYEKIEEDKMRLVDSLNEPKLYPEVRLITTKCIDEVSLVLDELWKEIMECQAIHIKTIKKTRLRIESVIKVKA
jgi:hypothetical protein